MAKRKEDQTHQSSSRLPFDIAGEEKANELPQHTASEPAPQDPSASTSSPPDFEALLRHPLVDEPLPDDFDAATEARQLVSLWTSTAALRKYQFHAFVFAGGSGMVFQVNRPDRSRMLALKVARKKLFELSTDEDIASSLSPMSEAELRALDTLSHPNLVRLEDVLETHVPAHGGTQRAMVFGIATSYVESPKPFNAFMRLSLARREARQRSSGFSQDRLDRACTFLASRLIDISSALAHMHEQKIYHFDVKPANILIADNGHKPFLTDMGACIHASDLAPTVHPRVHFTWSYAHPDLQRMSSKPKGISYGGLKASALAETEKGLARFDLYAFGKTILELLGILEKEYGERCHSTYGFRYLHLIGCLLLDGRNAPGEDEDGGPADSEGRYFTTDLALGYPRALFAGHRIATAAELYERLSRFSESSSSSHLSIPELDPWQAKAINLSAGTVAPFTERVAAVVSHPAFQRLKAERQLGWVSEVYPGATHTRWAHSIGVYANLTSYYGSLLSDSEIPTFRIIVDKADIEHALVAGLIHDICQSEFGHDFEAVNETLFDHKRFIKKLLDDTHWGSVTLRGTIERAWSGVDLERAFAMLDLRPSVHRGDHAKTQPRPVDGIGVDAIDGPIDADKLDYVVRDSHFCGLSYGQSVDRRRFFQSLTVTPVDAGANMWQFGLAYKSKGRAAIASVAIGRYELYESVYWHHTFRCIQAMFVHAAQEAFKTFTPGGMRVGNVDVAATTLPNIFYHRVICRKPWEAVQRHPDVKDRKLPAGFFTDHPRIDAVLAEPALDYVWRVADQRTKGLIELLAQRVLYKRIFELRVSAVSARTDYSRMSAALDPASRVAKANAMQDALLDAVSNKMRRDEPAASATEVDARGRFDELSGLNVALIVMDFPTRGVPEEPNVPREISDHERKYFVAAKDDSDTVFFSRMRELQAGMATLRVYAHPSLHQLITRYLDSTDVSKCMHEHVPGLKPRR